jgi:hypothetical protein
MDGTNDGLANKSWALPDAWPTAKQRAGVLQAVRRVLDALVPERTPPRHVEHRGGVQRYRSPRGCILQDDRGAVTVSWFPANADEALGELQVISWAGVVSRPGATQRAAGGARPVAETLFCPVDGGAEEWSWRAAGGAVLDSRALAEHCLALLASHSIPPSPVAVGV